jgi:hypothetical protein
MLHDASEHDDFEPASVHALPELLRLLDDRGWTSVGLEKLLDAPRTRAEPLRLPADAEGEPAMGRRTARPAVPKAT